MSVGPRFARALALSLLAQLSLSTTTRAQASPRTTRAAVRGTVVDEHDRPLANAVVALPSLQRQAITNDSGRFQFRELPATTLVLEVRRLGYQSETRTIRLSAGEPLALTVRVRRAAVRMDEVVVTGTGTASDRRGAVRRICIVCCVGWILRQRRRNVNAHALTYLTRGSSTAYRISASSDPATVAKATITVIPSRTG